MQSISKMYSLVFLFLYNVISMIEGAHIIMVSHLTATVKFNISNFNFHSIANNNL